MIKKFALSILLFGVSLPVYADFAGGDKTLTFFGGAGGASTPYDYQPGNQEKVTGGGGAFGGQFLYYIKGTPAVAVGLDVNNSLNGNGQESDLLSGINTTERVKTLVGLVIARLSYPRGIYRPYIFGGVGVHDSLQQLSGTPQPGVTWPGGGTENRVLVDQRKTSAALGGGIGVDVFMTETAFFGLELRGTWLAGMDTDDTAALRAAGFRVDEKRGIAEGNLFFRAGVKFGS